MAHTVLLEDKAVKSLKQISQPYKGDILKRLNELQHFSERLAGVKKLRGYKNGYRLRVGNYRVLFVLENDKKEIRIYTLGHRKDVYKN